MAILFRNIKKLVGTHRTNDALRGPGLAALPYIDNAFLVVEGERIAAFGPMTDLEFKDFAEVVDCTGRMILPAWCDSHTHIVFAGSREEEFVDKIRGASYAAIAAKGGGIQNSARRLQETGEDELLRQATKRLEEVARLGTGAVEIKSGYGLTVEAELKMLRVIRRLKKESRLSIKATFLGAHTIPAPYGADREAYIQLIVHDMLPRVAAEGLADYIDVFCEKGFFTPEETILICDAGKAAGLKPKIHANQLHVSGGVQAGIAAGALSVDHLESMDDAAVKALATSKTIGTLLPTAALFLRMPYGPARGMIDAGCAIALASDYNPGSSPSGNMNLVVSLACIGMKMLPEEAINAATLNGAVAMECENELGSIAVGKKASFFRTQEIPSLAYLPYAFGSNLVDGVWISGEQI